MGVVGAVTIGAIGATLVAPSALADDPEHPTWADVRRAESDSSASEAEVVRITALIGDLQDRADAAGRTAAIAAERWHRAELAEDSARQRHAALAQQADLAAATARTSRMRAGLLAASLARSGGGDLRLMLDGAGADDFLHRLATVSQLSAQSQAITRLAVADENEATALGAQSDAAAGELARRSAAAQDALDAARSAVAAAATAVSAEQRHADRLIAQLAELRGTSTRLAAQYAAAARAERADDPRPSGVGGPPPAAPPRAAIAPTSPATSPSGSAAPSSAAPPPAPGGGSASGSAVSGGGSPSGVGSAPTAAAPSAPVPTPAGSTPSVASGDDVGSVAPSVPSPEPVEPAPVAPAPSAGEPNSAQAASAVAYARDQIGDAYAFAGSGPSSWDCSGLTMQSYASAGIGIGGHSATAQYGLARAQGKLVPFAQARVGDLVFYSDGGGDMYHVAIYSGAGMMIEAPYPGVAVREVPVRSADRVGQVARPTAAAS